MSTIGKNIDEVERLAYEQVGCKYAVGLNSGTSALHLAVRLAGVKPGDKVFCSDMTFDATVNPVSYEGGTQVFIDSEYETWNMDPKALEKAFELYPNSLMVVFFFHEYRQGNQTTTLIHLFRLRSDLPKPVNTVPNVR